MNNNTCGRGVAGDFCALPAGHDGPCNPTRRLPEPDAFSEPADVEAIRANERVRIAAWLSQHTSEHSGDGERDRAVRLELDWLARKIERGEIGGA